MTRLLNTCSITCLVINLIMIFCMLLTIELCSGSQQRKSKYSAWYMLAPVVKTLITFYFKDVRTIKHEIKKLFYVKMLSFWIWWKLFWVSSSGVPINNFFFFEVVEGDLRLLQPEVLFKKLHGTWLKLSTKLDLWS